MPDAYIFDAVRTPRGRTRKDGGLMNTHPQKLMATCLKGIAERNNLDPKEVDDVVVGCVSQIGEQGACIARMSVLAADWPDAVPGVTLNRFCGSGLQALNFALMGVMSGQQDLVVGGGVESMSRVPMGADMGGLGGNNPDLDAKHPMVPQGISADLIATMEEFDRVALDRFAAGSQQKAARAVEEHRFDKSLIPVPNGNGYALEKDEYLRPGTTVETLAALKPAFADFGASGADDMALSRYTQVKSIQHRHTAGNSSGIVDGAGAVLVGSLEKGKSLGLKPRAKVRSVAVAGAEPVIMLTAPVPASQKALAKAGMTVNDIDLFEINEAFAAIPMYVAKHMNIDMDKVNVNGGAIALGHPLGGTGAILAGTLLDELERQNKSTGLITLCIGGGMGIATVIERV
jgi:acetyl-CoA C-acetyltransferase